MFIRVNLILLEFRCSSNARACGEGVMEGWRDGGLEGWRVGGLEEVHDIGNLLLATSSKIPEGIGKFVCESQPEIKDGSDAVERTDTRSESRSEAGD
jgi:hypothetical protein